MMTGFRKMIMMANQIDDKPYLCIEALEDGMQVSLSDNGYGESTEYSYDKIHWNVLPAGTFTPEVNTGKKVYFRAELTSHYIMNTTYDVTNSKGIGKFTITKKCSLSGTPITLLKDKELSPFSFKSLFADNTTVVAVADDFLPSAILADYCYYAMFYKCSNLVSAPLLMAETTKIYCYAYMFQNCVSLNTTQDILPAFSISVGSYRNMFLGCTSLTKAPYIACSLYIGSNGCAEMFKNCTLLTDVQNTLFTENTTLSYGCCMSMFSGCTSLTTAPELPAVNGVSYGACYHSMFFNCKSLSKVPDILPATTLGAQCYQSMFNGCTSLATAPELPAADLKPSCYVLMFSGCSNLVEIPDLLAVEMNLNSYNSIFNSCKKVNYIKALFSTTPSADYNRAWNTGVASTGTIVLNKNIEWNPEDYRNGKVDNIEGSATLGETITWGIPAGWTVKYCDPDNIEDVRDEKW